MYQNSLLYLMCVLQGRKDKDGEISDMIRLRTGEVPIPKRSRSGKHHSGRRSHKISCTTDADCLNGGTSRHRSPHTLADVVSFKDIEITEDWTMMVDEKLKLNCSIKHRPIRAVETWTKMAVWEIEMEISTVILRICILLFCIVPVCIVLVRISLVW